MGTTDPFAGLTFEETAKDDPFAGLSFEDNSQQPEDNSLLDEIKQKNAVEGQPQVDVPIGGVKPKIPTQEVPKEKLLQPQANQLAEAIKTTNRRKNLAIADTIRDQVIKDKGILDTPKAIEGYARALERRGYDYEFVKDHAEAVREAKAGIITSDLAMKTPDGKTAENLFKNATYASVLGDYDKAIEGFDELLKTPGMADNADVWTGRGNAYMGKGEYDKAQESFANADAIKKQTQGYVPAENEAVFIDPMNPANVVYNLGKYVGESVKNVALGMGQGYGQAKEDYGSVGGLATAPFYALKNWERNSEHGESNFLGDAVSMIRHGDSAIAKDFKYFKDYITQKRDANENPSLITKEEKTLGTALAKIGIDAPMQAWLGKTMLSSGGIKFMATVGALEKQGVPVEYFLAPVTTTAKKLGVDMENQSEAVKTWAGIGDVVVMLGMTHAKQIAKAARGERAKPTNEEIKQAADEITPNEVIATAQHPESAEAASKQKEILDLQDDVGKVSEDVKKDVSDQIETAQGELDKLVESIAKEKAVEATKSAMEEKVKSYDEDLAKKDLTPTTRAIIEKKKEIVTKELDKLTSKSKSDASKIKSTTAVGELTGGEESSGSSRSEGMESGDKGKETAGAKEEKITPEEQSEIDDLKLEKEYLGEDFSKQERLDELQKKAETPPASVEKPKIESDGKTKEENEAKTQKDENGLLTSEKPIVQAEGGEKPSPLVEKPSIAKIKSKVIKKAPQAKKSAKEEGVSLKVQKEDLLNQIEKAQKVVEDHGVDEKKLNEAGFKTTKTEKGLATPKIQVVFDVEGDGTFHLAADGLKDAHEQVSKHWSVKEQTEPVGYTGGFQGKGKTIPRANRMPSQKAIGDYDTPQKAEASKQIALENLAQAKADVESAKKAIEEKTVTAEYYDSFRKKQTTESRPKTEREIKEDKKNLKLAQEREAVFQKQAELESEKYVQAKRSVTEAGESVKQWAKDVGIVPKNFDPTIGTSGYTFNDLVDLTVKLIHKGIDIHGDIKKAIDEALEKIRGFKAYKDLVGDKAADFEKQIRETVEPKEVKETGIRHEDTAALRQGAGLEEYERNPETQAAWEAEAEKQIKEGYNIEALLDRTEKGVQPTSVEQKILKKYIASVADKINTDPSDANLQELKRLTDASDRIAGSAVAKSLVARQGTENIDDTLAGYFMHEMAVNNDAPLTEGQKATVVKEFNEIKQAKEALEKKMADIENENNQLKAEKEVEKTIREVRRTGRKTTREKLDSEFDDLSKKFSKIASGTLSAGINPELVAIVVKMAKNRVEKGITKLADVVDNIHEKVSEHLSKKDITDILAGVHNEKKPTRSEASAALTDLKQEAKLINKIESLQSGVEPKTEKRKIRKNQELEALRKQIKEHDLTKLADYKSRVQAQITKVENDLAKGILQPEKKAQIKLDAEALRLKDKYIKVKQEREIRLLKQQYENRSKYEKTRDKLTDIANVPRTIMSSMDFSAPLRQAVVATVAHPITASKAAVEMFKQSVSQKRFDRWFHDVKEDPLYPRSQEAGLYIADPHDPRLSVKEEAFMNNLAEKIPIVGRFIKGSERAYVGYLNKMRWDLFHQFADQFEVEGKTFQNSPELYKGLASFVNNSTGRGEIGALESAAPILNSVFFALRLIASRLNFLNPVYYAKLPKQVRVQALKDVGKFIGTGLTVMALAKLNGAQVEDDPRSTDFGKIRSGNMRWDIWGGYQQYIRVLTQLFTGQSKSTQTGKINELNGEGIFGRTRGDVALSFARGKLAPIPSIVADILAGRTTSGDKTTLSAEAQSHLLPLLYNDVYQAMQDQGMKALFTAGLPSAFGVGVQTYGGKKSSGAVAK